ncbi:hypothetical protein OGATHE_002579 [Ogataea polymorpha]|uniref:Uncharacterized protein n=1 Tax=Ogataea polymorpha TaxID=460523 RepID=A0A9P8PD29_9ASCO|nr:hypothetical protein OGATHE_002579 [Ogataea polymorpha]
MNFAYMTATITKSTATTYTLEEVELVAGSCLAGATAAAASLLSVVAGAKGMVSGNTSSELTAFFSETGFSSTPLWPLANGAAANTAGSLSSDLDCCEDSSWIVLVKLL